MRWRFFGRSSQPTNLAELIASYGSKKDGEPQRQLLRAAESLVRGDTALEDVRDHARRNFNVPLAALLELLAEADLVGKTHPHEMYAIVELIQAAAVATCPISPRNMMSGRLAIASKQVGLFERARRAYADYLEGIWIVASVSDESEQLRLIEESILAGWDEVKGKTKAKLEILSPLSADPSDEWFDLILWNSDFDSQSNILAQTEATLRLALHIDHWNGASEIPLDTVIDKMLVRSQTLRVNDEPKLMMRSILTIGNALLEIGQWDLAATTHALLLEVAKREDDYAYPIQASLQAARCRLMSNDIGGCRELLTSLDKGALEAGADLILVGAAQLVQYLFLEQQCFQRLGEGEPPGSAEAIVTRLRTVGSLYARHPADRRSSLASLFFLVLAKEVEMLPLNKSDAGQ